jgi:transposase
MAMGKQREDGQGDLWIATTALPRTSGHPFYQRLNAVLKEHGFDAFAEAECAQYYAEKMGRPSIPPGAYFRMLFIGYFEGIDSERGIAWRVADSMALRKFLGYRLDASTPNHSSVSRTRRRLSVETHDKVFSWILTVLAKEGLLQGKTIGVDATTLEANAAMRSIIRRDTGEGYEGFLARLAKASGIETPTREDLARLDRKRPKKGSNKEWEHPDDPDAAITKMKDTRTHLAHKAEHAVDMDTQAVVAATLPGADEGDPDTLPWTLMEAEKQLAAVSEDADAARHLHEKPLSEVVTDKGYHSNDSLTGLDGIRTYISEPNRGRRNWKGKPDAKKAVYANRRRIRGQRGKALLRKRGEYLERSFAHAYETGGMRRLHLRHRSNILKRLLLHIGGFNLGLVMRKLFGKGTPRGLRDMLSSLFGQLACCIEAIRRLWTRLEHRDGFHSHHPKILRAA